MNLVFDLDGTLIDARLRMHRLFCQLVPNARLDFDAYWNFKRAKVSHRVLLSREFGYPQAKIDEFEREWLSKIESPDYLALDTCCPGIERALTRLKSQANLHLCTARQHRQLVLGQLELLGLVGFFERIMVTEHRVSKQELIAAMPDRSALDWVIGDTGHDVEVGKLLGMRTCAVLTGFLSRAILEPYGPDLIFESAADFSLPPASRLVLS
jgi:phosphoglycolate phosphatase